MENQESTTNQQSKIIQSTIDPVQTENRLIVVVKKDCPTCNLVVPVLRQVRAAQPALTIYTQDDPGFPDGLDPVDDTSLEQS